jgi:hypothetical protein
MKKEDYITNLSVCVFVCVACGRCMTPQFQINGSVFYFTGVFGII